MPHRNSHSNENDNNPINSNIIDALLSYHIEDTAVSTIIATGDINALVECNILTAEEFCETAPIDEPLLRPLLHIAINFLDINLVQVLLQKGANPNTSNSYG